MARGGKRLRECSGCGRVFNAQVNHGKCPKCGEEVAKAF